MGTCVMINASWYETVERGAEPWLYDGLTLTLMGDVYPGTGSSSPGFFGGFTAFNGDL